MVEGLGFQCNNDCLKQLNKHCFSKTTFCFTTIKSCEHSMSAVCLISNAVVDTRTFQWRKSQHSEAHSMHWLERKSCSFVTTALFAECCICIHHT